MCIQKTINGNLTNDYFKTYYQRNKEKIFKTYYQRNKEKIRNYATYYYHNNRDKIAK